MHLSNFPMEIISIMIYLFLMAQQRGWCYTNITSEIGLARKKLDKSSFHQKKVTTEGKREVKNTLIIAVKTPKGLDKLGRKGAYR